MSKKDIDKAAISAVTGEMPQQFQNFVEQQSRVSSKKEAKANVGKENQVSISIPLEWDDGLAELCREIREGHPEYSRCEVIPVSSASWGTVRLYANGFHQFALKLYHITCFCASVCGCEYRNKLSTDRDNTSCLASLTRCVV